MDVNLSFMGLDRNGGGLLGSGLRREGVTTLGAKYDFGASTFRAQVDSSERLSCLLEKESSASRVTNLCCHLRDQSYVTAMIASWRRG
jgi:hypothetical protein